MQDSERQWSFSIAGEDLSLRNVRLPSISEADSRAHISQRIACIHLLSDLIDELFKSFMEIRTSSYFQEELTKIREWIDNKAII